MKRLSVVILALTVAGASPATSQTPQLERMPPALETRWALSALPPALRDQATVYLLDPAIGYTIARQGTSGVECLVERTVWEWADMQLRDDIYIPLCYDAAGAKAHLRVMREVAELRAKGMTADAIKTEVADRYARRIYSAPARPGLSYMVSPVFRAIGPPDLKIHTMAMPHVMFYAPGVTNEDIGTRFPSLADPASWKSPFIDRQGNAEQSFIIQMVGDAEKAKILADEKRLVVDLCAYRAVLCLPKQKHLGGHQ